MLLIVFTCFAIFWLQLASCLTEWQLLAHGSDRFIYNSSGKSWKSSTGNTSYHFVEWAVPYGFSATLPGSVSHRDEDGHIHVMLLGTEYLNIGSEWPGGGSTKMYGPPLIWELEPREGKTIGIYNLSTYGETFYSIVRYTPSGNIVVAVCSQTSNDYLSIEIIILDKNTHKVIYTYKPNMEPMLIQTTNTSPQELLYAGMNSDAFLTYNTQGTMPDNNDNEVLNEYISTIMFSADGKTICNNGFTNEETGIYKLNLPFTSNSRPSMIVNGCETFPWVFTGDINGNLYHYCNSEYIEMIDKTNKQIWKYNIGSLSWLIIDDNAMYVIGGLYSNNEWFGWEASTGKLLWTTKLSDIEDKNDEGLKCYQSAQPWANRHPIPMPNGKLVILCSTTNNGYDLRTIDIKTGKKMGMVHQIGFNVAMLSADTNAIYAWGANGKAIVGERIPM